MGIIPNTKEYKSILERVVSEKIDEIYNRLINDRIKPIDKIHRHRTAF